MSITFGICGDFASNHDCEMSGMLRNCKQTVKLSVKQTKSLLESHKHFSTFGLAVE